MDGVIRTHKETTVGGLLMVQAWIAARKAWLARLAHEQAAKAIRDARATPRRYLAPR